MLVGIHQPNFLPWLGYFAKLARCDRFVLLDEAQFPKTGGNWINRVRILIGGVPRWLSVPVARPPGVQKIRDVMISDPDRWRRKICRTIEQSYRGHPHFAEVFAFLEHAISCPTPRLAETNAHAISAVARFIGVNPDKLVLESDLDGHATGTERLIELTRAVRGTTYCSGDGSADYLDADAFGAHGMGLTFMSFRHPVYPQRDADMFVPGLSIIDALFNLGPRETGRLVAETVVCAR